MRAFAGLFVGGIAGILVLKLLATLIFPLFGLFFGLLGMAIKLAIFAAVAYFVYTLVRNRRRERTV